MFGLLLIAAALGLSNFAAAIGIGISGIDASVRLRVALVFGLFEAAMPLVGLVLGRQLASSFGSMSAYVGGGLLIATGTYTVLQTRWNRSAGPGRCSLRPARCHRSGAQHRQPGRWLRSGYPQGVARCGGGP